MAYRDSTYGFYASASGHRRCHHVPRADRRLTMFTRIIRFATRFPKSVIVAWAIVALALGSLSGRLGYKVMTDDTAGYVPESAESAQAARYGEEHFGTQKGARTVVVLVKRGDGRPLHAADRAEVRALAASM